MSRIDYTRFGCCLVVMSGTVIFWIGAIWGIVRIFK